jgi:hypothetical protein
MKFCARSNALKTLERGGENRPLVFSLEVGKFPQCFQKLFQHFAAFWAIEITTEFLFVGMAVLAHWSTASPFTPMVPGKALRLR